MKIETPRKQKRAEAVQNVNVYHQWEMTLGGKPHLLSSYHIDIGIPFGYFEKKKLEK